jgi:hypothetical protein
MYLYNEINSQDHKTFSYILVNLFKEGYFNNNSRAFCIAFKNIFLRNIADTTITQEFSFSFLIDYAYYIVSENILFYII